MEVGTARLAADVQDLLFDRDIDLMFLHAGKVDTDKVGRVGLIEIDIRFPSLVGDIAEVAARLGGQMVCQMARYDMAVQLLLRSASPSPFETYQNRSFPMIAAKRPACIKGYVLYSVAIPMVCLIRT